MWLLILKQKKKYFLVKFWLILIRYFIGRRNEPPLILYTASEIIHMEVRIALLKFYLHSQTPKSSSSLPLWSSSLPLSLSLPIIFLFLIPPPPPPLFIQNIFPFPYFKSVFSVNSEGKKKGQSYLYRSFPPNKYCIVSHSYVLSMSKACQKFTLKHILHVVLPRPARKLAGPEKNSREFALSNALITSQKKIELRRWHSPNYLVSYIHLGVWF